MKNIPILVLFLLCTATAKAQLTAQKFITGSGVQSEGCWDAFVMDFNTDPPTITPKQGPVMLHSGCRTHTTISDRNGNIQFFFDNNDLYDKNFNILKGGQSLLPFANNLQPCSKSIEQMCIALPVPGFVDEKYYLFYNDAVEGYTGSTDKMMYGIIDMNRENGLGEMILRDSLLLEDKENRIGGLTAVRHGNGKDWWLMSYSARKSYRKIRYLVTSKGIEGPMIQEIYNPQITDLSSYYGATARNYGFSPDGSKLAQVPATAIPYFVQGVECYDFDRCTGELSNLQFYLPDSVRWGNTVWSPNSRFIYMVYYRNIGSLGLPLVIDSAKADIVLQIDTWNPNSQTNTYRVFEAPKLRNPPPHPNPDCPGTPSPTVLSSGILGLNGKVYINSEQSFFSTIHQPDSLGAACQFKYGDLPVNYMYRSMPAYINYQLYDKSDSPCDTSGVNGYTSVLDLQLNQSIAILNPNPSSGIVDLNYCLHIGQRQGLFKLYDLTGRELFLESLLLPKAWKIFDLSHLPTGLYYWSLTDAGGIVGGGKLVKVE
jgi:hypothetical protein